MNMDFMEVKERIRLYLEGKHEGDIDDIVNRYMKNIFAEKEQMAQEAKALLSLLQVGVSQPFTQEQAIRFGNVGTIAMGTHYAYPLLAMVLGYWVEAECSIAIAKGLGEEERKNLRSDIEKQIEDFDVYGYEVREKRHDYLLDRLFAPSPPPAPSLPPDSPSLIQKVLSIFR